MGMETSSAQIRRTACGVELWPGLDVKPLDLIVDKTRFGAFVAEVTGPNSVVHHSNFQPLMTEMGSELGPLRCPRHVRFPPDRDQIADVSTLRFRAIMRHATLFTLVARRAVGRRQSGSRSRPDPYAPEQIQRR